MIQELKEINRTDFPCALETHVPLCEQLDVTFLRKTKVGRGEETYLLKQPNPVTVNGQRVSLRGLGYILCARPYEETGMRC